MRARLADLPLRRKLVRIIMLTSGSALFLASIALFVFDMLQFRETLREDLTVLADIIAENSAAAIAFSDSDAAAQTLATLRARPGVESASLYDAQGQLFAEYHRDAERRPIPDKPAGESYTFTADSFVLFKPVRVENKLVGTLYLRSELTELFTHLGMQTLAIGIIMLMSAAAAYWLSNRLQTAVSEPILDLAETARAISRDKNYSVRATPRGRDELGALVDAFNQMLGQIQKRESQLEEANRLKDEFLATASHELRTPLNAILGWTGILRGDVGTPQARGRALEVIERNTQALAHLVEDILDVSRIIAGKLRLDVQPVDLRAVVRAAVDVIRPAAQAKNVTIGIRSGPDEPITMGDPHRLQQVVWNLLSNAVKFSAPDSTIQIDVDEEKDNYRVRVTDEGVGISADLLPYIFDPFRQADASSTRAHGGLGLGLAIVRRLTELHGGSVSAASGGEGKGATFTVCLPRRAPVRSVSVPSTELPRRADSLAGLHVLVVEDEPDARDQLEVTLRHYGAEVTAVGSTKEALDVIANFTPDVLVSDIAMAGEDGHSLMRKIRRLSPARGGLIPAVALTAYADETSRARSLASGFQYHIAKPYNPLELVRTLETVKG